MNLYHSPKQKDDEISRLGSPSRWMGLCAVAFWVRFAMISRFGVFGTIRGKTRNRKKPPRVIPELPRTRVTRKFGHSTNTSDDIRRCFIAGPRGERFQTAGNDKNLSRVALLIAWAIDAAWIAPLGRNSLDFQLHASSSS
jgi:hypothetical protein